ncbi:MAG: MgtC/SapB family protein [Waterburya sp.]
MNTITWSEIAVRLLFAFIIGSGVAIETKWYRTRKLLESNAQMATGAAMFAILIQITSNTIGASELILGVSIVCAGILIQKQIEPQNINTVIKLWCAGAAGALVGYGLFVPAYLGTLIVVLASWVFKIEDLEFMPNMKADLADLNDNSHLDSQVNLQNDDLDNLDNNEDIEKISNIAQQVPISPTEMHYQCQVICPVAEEAKVLALLVQLGKDQKLIASSLSSHNMVDSHGLSEVQIEIDFVAQENENSPMQLQQILSSLKSQVGVSSASWVCLSPGSNQKIEQAKGKRKVIHSTYRNHRQFVIKN